MSSIAPKYRSPPRLLFIPVRFHISSHAKSRSLTRSRNNTFLLLHLTEKSPRARKKSLSFALSSHSTMSLLHGVRAAGKPFTIVQCMHAGVRVLRLEVASARSTLWGGGSNSGIVLQFAGIAMQLVWPAGRGNVSVSLKLKRFASKGGRSENVLVHAQSLWLIYR